MVSLLALQIDDREVEFNDSGYMMDFDEWDDEIANALAAADDLKLTQSHWAVINYIRELFGEYEITPSVTSVIKAAGDKISEQEPAATIIDQLFPQDGYNQACRLAGLPESF